MSKGFETKSADSGTIVVRAQKPTEVAEIRSIQQTLVEQFAEIKDPRVERTKKHQLTDILIIAILAVIAGAQGWEDIENYGISKHALVRRVFGITKRHHQEMIHFDGYLSSSTQKH